MTEFTTTLARAWSLRRTDGVTLGFTDHDRDLSFGDIVFRAGTGLTASALVQSTGLAVDNTEAVGALSDAGLCEDDIRAGLYDAAEVTLWQVDWVAPGDRQILFRGTLGEITREGGAFRAELRGLSEPLLQTQGRVFGGMCPWVLGDDSCRFDPQTPGFAATVRIEAVDAEGALLLPLMPEFPEGWFSEGRVVSLDGAGAGQTAMIRRDRHRDAALRLELWHVPFRPFESGGLVRLEAGCDKRLQTCRQKFANAVNFGGFPHIPGEDWLIATPRVAGASNG